MKAEDRERFKGMLLETRAQLSGNVNHMESEALRNSGQNASGDLSNMPMHMADVGSDNYEKEFTIELIQTEEAELRQIDEALLLIEDDTFGECEACGKRIPKERLKVIPYTTMCVNCKKEEEIAAGGQ